MNSYGHSTSEQVGCQSQQPAQEGAGAGFSVASGAPGGTPPAGKTGVFDTEGKGLVVMDWLRLVFPDRPEVREDLWRWFPEREPRRGSFFGVYDRSWWLPGMGIFADCTDRERAEVQGVIVDLPAQALGLLGARLGDYVKWAVSVGGRASRVDWAIDDYEGRITRERLRACEDGGGILTRWRETGWRTSRKGGQPSGWTFTMGSRQSEAYLRIYDKKLQQGGTDRPHWVRVELECKGALAPALLGEVLERGGVAVVEQLNRRVRFVEPGEGQNRARWRACPWWEALMGTLRRGAALVARPRLVDTLAGMLEVLERQAGPMMATVVQADGGAIDALIDIVRRSVSRMGVRHWGAVQAAAMVAAGG